MRLVNQYALGLLLVLIGALGFSVKSILIKLAYSESPNLDAISLLTLRMVFALPVFIIAALWHRRRVCPPALSKKQWFAVILLGLDGYYLASFLDFVGLQYIAAGLERVILFLYPTFVVLFLAAFHRRRIAASTLLALGLSYGGLVLVFVDHLTTASQNLWFGAAMVFASAVVFSFFTLGSGVMVHTIGSFRFTAYSMTVAGIAILIQFTFVGDLNALTGLAGGVYGLVFLIAIFSTVLPAFCMNAGIRRIGADHASIISSTGPIMTLVVAHFILQESITMRQLAGTVFILAGVFVLGRKTT